MYEFWYYYVKPKYAETAKLYYKDTNSFIINVKTEDIMKILTKIVKQNLTLQILN